MSEELEKLKRQVVKVKEAEKRRHKERYKYAKSLGFSAAMAARLQRSGKEKILRLSKELKRS